MKNADSSSRAMHIPKLAKSAEIVYRKFYLVQIVKYELEDGNLMTPQKFNVPCTLLPSSVALQTSQVAVLLYSLSTRHKRTNKSTNRQSL